MTPKAEDGRSDAELAALVRTGKPAQRRRAFDALTTRHQPWLGRLLYSLLGSNASAEDVLQETLVRAFLASDRFPEGPGLRAWFRTIAVRTAFNYRREARTRRRYADAYSDATSIDVPPPEGGVMSREVLELALGRMSYPMREVLVLRHVEELTVPEIAENLQLGLSAAKMRLSRARAEFVETYEKLSPGGGSPETEGKEK